MPATTTTTLDELKWKHRIIAYAAANGKNAPIAPTLERYADAIAERAIVFIDLHPSVSSPERFHIRLSQTELRALKARLKPASDATTLFLIGKDGSLKKTINHFRLPILFEAIDQMPMRRAEIRQ